MSIKRPPCQLYLITPPQIIVAEFTETLKRALAAGPVAALQLRLKNTSDDDIVRAGEALKPICRAHDVALIINDRADLARALGADGVHLGQSDGDIKDARKLLGIDAQIGVTCHNSRHFAMEAGEAGADYVAFGAFYPTTTKNPPDMATPDILTWWTDLAELPCVAIGGITTENARPLVEAGADFLAVSAGVWAYPQGVEQAVRGFVGVMG